MNRRPINLVCKTAVIATALTLNMVGCSVVTPRALEPIDWTNKEVGRHAVTGNGAWARLRNEPLIIGSFSAVPKARRSWSDLPTETTTDLEIAIGNEDGRQLRAGTVSRHNESELNIHLSDNSESLTEIRCRELFHIESEETGVTRSDGTDSMRMSELVEYHASLNCQSRGFSTSWPHWQLDLDNHEPGPLHGVLHIDDRLFDVVGSQSSSIGQLPQTVSFEIRNGDSVMALIDRSGDGQLSIVYPVAKKLHLAFTGAAAVLLLANDPVEQ